MNVSAVDLVLRVASATVGASEIPANTNRGPYVERVLALCGLKPGDPWCACHVANVGVSALGKDWPLPKVGGCQSLYEWANKKKLVKATPERGDVFLVWHPELSRFAHTGFVVAVNADHTATTNEGNTSGGGSREGWLVAERTRAFTPDDRFIRWAALLKE